MQEEALSITHAPLNVRTLILTEFAILHVSSKEWAILALRNIQNLIFLEHALYMEAFPLIS